MVTAILAQSKDHIIGTTGKDGPCIPWHLPADLKRFKRLTTGHAIIMGRTTFESIRKPLPDRLNIVVSRTRLAGASIDHILEYAPSPERALEMALVSDPYPFIIGGGQIYSALWPRVDRVELTRVDTIVGLGLVFAWDPIKFAEVNRSEELEHEGLRFRFETYERVRA